LIKAIIWDIGGVLGKMDNLTPIRNWEKRLGLPSEQLTNIIFNNPLAEQALIGKVTAEEFWQDIGKQLDLSIEEVEQLKGDFNKAGVWDTKLLAFIQSLKPSYKMGIISGAMSDARKQVQEYVNYSLFEVIIFSAEEGIQKPDPVIYQRALSRLNVEAHEAIFIDDWLASIEGARNVGLHTLHYTEGIDIYEEIRQLIAQESSK
jgi:putative hydrolase of the HAD superfamily